ncbi:MAG: hypothetical protein ABSC20_06135 [Candidatus Bathyarchaeia archaeon]|jgi:hypothetical protein
MTKRFTAIIIIANVIMGLLLYLSSQVMLLHLTASHPYLTVTGVNIDKIYVGAVQPYSSPTPLVITAFPNLAFYLLLLSLIISAYFIIKVSRSSGIAKRFPVTIIIANIITGLLMFLSSQTMLSQLSGTMNNYVRVLGVNFWSIYVGAVQVGSSPIPLVIWGELNLPSYVFMLSLMVNACFIIKLLISKEPKQNPS